MTEPTGYTAVGMVGFTDQGTYSASASYVKNDLVHYGGSIWCCLIDDTMGIEPTDGVNWRFWVENSQEGISDIVNMLGAKNLLKIKVEIPSLYGITVKDNGDGSITVDGQATTDAYFNLMRYDFGNIRFATDGTSDNSNYILSGLPSNGNFFIAYNPSTKIVTLVVKVAYGAVDNVTIYPMVRPKNIEDDTWQPYTKTNKELTEEVTQNSSDIQTLTNKDTTIESEISDMVNVLGSKNMLPNTATTQVINGITFTVNDDGSVTANGTATADSSFQINKLTLPKGTYVLNGCPSGGAATTYRLFALPSGKSPHYDNGNGVQFAVTDNTLIYYVRIVIFNGQTVSNLTFYPMIRPSSIVDDTYVPYAMTNHELTSQISNNANAIATLLSKVTFTYATKINFTAFNDNTGFAIDVYVADTTYWHLWFTSANYKLHVQYFVNGTSQFDKSITLS